MPGGFVIDKRLSPQFISEQNFDEDLAFKVAHVVKPGPGPGIRIALCDECAQPLGIGISGRPKMAILGVFEGQHWIRKMLLCTVPRQPVGE